MAKRKRNATSEIDSGPTKKQIRDRRRYLRRKEADGTISDDERTELTGHAETDPPAELPGDLPPGIVPEGATSGDQVPVMPGTPALPPSLPPLPEVGGFAPPPRVRDRADGQASGKSSGRWQDGYTIGTGASAGAGQREATCQYLGSLWHGVLRQMAGHLREAGIDPVIDPDRLAGAIVLAVDDLLPPHVELTPTLVAVGSSTALLAQRAIKRDEIAAARKKKAILAAGAGVSPVRVSSVLQTEPKPAPAPEPTGDRIVDESPPLPPSVAPSPAPRANGSHAITGAGALI
jgi:hypothetical protein